MSAGAYMRVSQAEPRTAQSQPHSQVQDVDEEKKRHDEYMERLNVKLHAFFWVIGAGFLVYKTDFVRVVLSDERVNR
jgi:hypothetical protein